MGKTEGNMLPTTGIVFVKEAPREIKKNKFEYAGEKPTEYVVTAIGDGVTACQPGDYVLFDAYHAYDFKGEKIIKVNELDIHGVYRG